MDDAKVRSIIEAIANECDSVDDHVYVPDRTPLTVALVRLYQASGNIYEDGEVGNDFFAAYEDVATILAHKEA